MSLGYAPIRILHDLAPQSIEEVLRGFAYIFWARAQEYIPKCVTPNQPESPPRDLNVWGACIPHNLLRDTRHMSRLADSMKRQQYNGNWAYLFDTTRVFLEGLTDMYLSNPEKSEFSSKLEGYQTLFTSCIEVASHSGNRAKLKENAGFIEQQRELLAGGLTVWQMEPGEFEYPELLGASLSFYQADLAKKNPKFHEYLSQSHKIGIPIISKAYRFLDP